ncbi:MAG: AMP-binding protein, partial [Anaerolineaceae bacterium]
MIRNILEYLEQSVKKYPDKIAFSDAGSQVSYQDLIAQAKAVGTCLADRLSGATNQPVVIFVDRTLHSLILFFGTVYSGNFYIPIDVKMPRHRIEAMLRALEPKLILSHCADEKVTTELGFASQAVTFIDAVSCAPDETKLANIRARSIDSDPLCVYYTSGSSGMPKGAILSHRSVIEMTEQFSSVFSFSDECIFGNQAAFDFSVSLKDIFSTLKHGAALHILPTELFTFPVRLIQCLNDKKINTAIWVTSAMRVIANLNGLDHTLPLYLQKMLFSGELMPVKVLNYWRKCLPHVQYVNLYGQSEIAYNCSYYIVDRRFENHEPLPAGNTFSNIDVFLLDGQGKPAGEGQV